MFVRPRRSHLLMPVALLAAAAPPAGAAIPQGAPVRACSIRSGAIQRADQRYSVRFVSTFTQCPKRAGHLWVRLQGLPGPATVQGPRGPQGVPGQAGEAGRTGAPGDAGPIGPRGATGDAGAAGTPGDAGATGAAGPQGPAGADGATGATGPAGPAGEPGPTGATGPEGPTGPQGPQGATGPAGPAYAMGYQVVTMSSALDTADPKGLSVNCPETYQVVVGGGYDYGASADDINWFVITNRPATSGRGWIATVHRADDGRAGEAWQLRAYAICVRDPSRN